MKILMVLEGVFPPDERVEKEIHSLLNDGHEVRIAAYSFHKASHRDDTLPYIIYRKHISRLMYKLGAAILVLPFYFGFWRRFINKVYSEWEFEAIHIHDLPLASLGAKFKKKWGVFFVADQHEFYSNWIVKTAHYNSLSGNIVKYFSNWKAYEENYLSQADVVCTVEEPLRTIYIEDRGIDPERIIAVPNTPLKSIYQVKKGEYVDEYYNLFYCGGMDHLRGLDLVIEALPLLREKIPEIRLVLVGKIGKHFDPRKHAAACAVEDLLVFRGWVDYRDLPHEIDHSDICFFTPPTNREEIHNTIATKIYQYMARGKPVIVGSARTMRDFVEKYEVGLAIDEKSPGSFAEAVIRIHSNPKLAEKFSKNALASIERFYWEQTILSLLERYRKLGQ